MDIRKNFIRKALSLGLAIITLLAVISNSCIFISAKSNEKMSYVEYQALQYARKFSVEPTTSFAYNFHKEMKEDKQLQSAIVAWETIHIVDSPSHHMDSGLIAKEDFYTIAIFDMLDASQESSIVSLFANSVYGDKEAAVYDLAQNICELMQVETNELDTVNISKLKSLLTQDAINEFVGNYKSSFADSLTEPPTILDFTIDAFNNVTQAIDALASYRAIANMREGVLQVLNAIAEDESNDPALRKAAKNCLPIFHTAYTEILNDIAAGRVLTEAAVKTVASLVLDKAWETFIGLCPSLTYASIAVKGFRVLMNATFDFDERIERYYKMESAVIIERALAKTVNKSKTAYTNQPNVKTATMLMESIWFYQKAVLQGIAYSIDYLEHYLESPGSQFYYWIIGKYDDMENAIANVKQHQIEQLNRYSILESNVRTEYISMQENYKQTLNDFANQIEDGSSSDAPSIDTSEFLKQELNYTCTLASAAMMIRRTAKMSGVEEWYKITEQALKKKA